MAVTTPQGFELFDPGTGGRLVASITNGTAYETDDLLIVYDAAGERLADGPAVNGIVNISGLVTGTAITLHARVLAGEELSDVSNDDTETPTATNAQLLVGSDAFARILITFALQGGTRIEWQLARTCKPVPPVTFFVQFSHAPDLDGDHWEDVATIIDLRVAIDPDQRLFKGMNQFAYYRIIMREATGKETISTAQQAIGQASRHDFLIAREVFRKESLRLERFVGTRGFLFKAKIFGEPCPSCLDFDTKSVTDSDCPECFGTAIIDGYHQPIEYFVELGLAKRHVHTDPNHGATEHIVRQCRGIAVPQLDKNDLWMRSDTDERFFIHEISEGARLAVPIISIFNMRKIPLDDPAYNVSVPVPA